MANEPTAGAVNVGNLKVTLEGDGRSYEKMLKDAQASTDKTAKSVADFGNEVEKEIGKLPKAASHVKGLAEAFRGLIGGKVGEWAEKAATGFDSLSATVGDTSKGFTGWLKSLADGEGPIEKMIGHGIALKDVFMGLGAASIAASFSTSWTMAATAVSKALNLVTVSAKSATAALTGLTVAGLGKFLLIAAAVTAAVYTASKAWGVYDDQQKQVEATIKLQTNLHERRMSSLEKEEAAILANADALVRFKDRWNFTEEALGQASGEVEGIRFEIEKLDKKIKESSTSSWWNLGMKIGEGGSLQDQAKMVQLRKQLKQAQDALTLGKEYEVDEEGETIYKPGAFPLYEPGEGSSGLLGRLEKEQEKAQQLRDKIQSLKDVGLGGVDLFDKIRKGAGMFGAGIDMAGLVGKRDAMEKELEQQDALIAKLEQFIGKVQDKQKVDAKAQAAIDGLNRGLREQMTLLFKTGDAAIIAKAKIGGVGEAQIRETKQLLDMRNQGLAIQAMEKDYNSFLAALEAGNATWGMSEDQIRLWRIQMAAAKNDFSLNDEKMKRLQDALDVKKRNQEDTKLTQFGKELTERFKDPLIKMLDEVAKVQEAFDKKKINADVYNKALEDIAKRYGDVEDAASKAARAIQGVEALLVGSAGANAAMRAYAESLAFQPKVFAAATGAAGGGYDYLSGSGVGPEITMKDRYRNALGGTLAAFDAIRGVSGVGIGDIPADEAKRRREIREFEEFRDKLAEKQGVKSGPITIASALGAFSPPTSIDIAGVGTVISGIKALLEQIQKNTARTAAKDPVVIDDADLDDF